MAKIFHVYQLNCWLLSWNISPDVWLSYHESRRNFAAFRINGTFKNMFLENRLATFSNSNTLIRRKVQKTSPVKHRSASFVLALFEIQRAFTCWWQHSSNGLMITVRVVRRHWRQCRSSAANWILISLTSWQSQGAQKLKIPPSFAEYQVSGVLPLVIHRPEEISARDSFRVLLLWTEDSINLAFQDFKSQKTHSQRPLHTSYILRL